MQLLSKEQLETMCRVESREWDVDDCDTLLQMAIKYLEHKEGINFPIGMEGSVAGQKMDFQKFELMGQQVNVVKNNIVSIRVPNSTTFKLGDRVMLLHIVPEEEIDGR